MKQVLATALLAAALITAAVAGPRAGILSDADKRHYTAAFAAADRGAWARAERFAQRGHDKLLDTVLLWLEMSQRGANVKFDTYEKFLKDHADWPYADRVRRRAEEAMTDGLDAHRVIHWFADQPPMTGDGMVRLGAALLEKGRKDDGIAMLRRAWVEGSFGRREERDFLRLYHRYLRKEDHAARLDRLLWDRHHSQARRTMRRVDRGLRHLAEARIALNRLRGGVDSAIDRIPANLTSDPGFLYERARWRRRKGRPVEAHEILATAPRQAEHAEAWWLESQRVARSLLALGHISDAYRLCRDHGPLLDAEFAEAEWTAGWIALRFLRDYAVARRHFEKLYANVEYPISRARGAYWAGRASEAMGEAESAEAWYRRAADHDLTFYGQLAASRLKQSLGTIEDDTPPPSKEVMDALRRDPRAQIVLRLAELDDQDLIKPFIRRLAYDATSPDRLAAIGALAVEIGRRDLGVVVARHAIQNGERLMALGYPTVDLPDGALEPALVHAIMRQESNFHTAARSHAGARGLMQLLPSTARAVSRAIKVRFSRRKLTSDGDYNIRLGRAYLGGLVEQFDGSYILAVAAYNAGPGAVKRWMRQNGDPRDPSVDVIDWIESIPYDETRNYVQRVMENLQVYRRLLGTAGQRQAIETDLKRGSGTG